MEYTILKLAQLANISTRTLRYYDEIGLLKPFRINEVGYRIYGQKEVDRLQQILFYRELDVSLKDICGILDSLEFNILETLYKHRDGLVSKREQIDILIKNLDKTIAVYKGEKIMRDKEKFEGFKQKIIDENEAAYGKEIREKYGRDAVEISYSKLKNMTKEQYDEMIKLEKDIKQNLHTAYLTGSPGGKLAQQVAKMHQQWICYYYWNEYSKEAHATLAQMYVDDERFKKYYDDPKQGMTEFLRDAIMIYTK